MKNNTPTVTICIPAHNEEANIGNLLMSIQLQKITSGRLTHVLVLCDGCTDNTAAVAKNMAKKNRAIEVVNDGKRLGKHRRLLRAFRTCKTDIAIVLDGDILLAHPFVLEELIKPFGNSEVSLVGGNNIPVPDAGLENYLINSWALLWFGIKQHVRRGVNVHNVRSCCLAMRISLIRKLEWPEELQSHGQFLYFEALHTKTRFVFARNATVWYRNPTTFADYAIQKKRGVGKRNNFVTRYGALVKKEYAISLTEKILAVTWMMFRHPIITMVASVCRLYLSVYFHTKSDSAKGHFWKIAESTKKGISMELFSRGSYLFTF